MKNLFFLPLLLIALVATAIPYQVLSAPDISTSSQGSVDQISPGSPFVSEWSFTDSLGHTFDFPIIKDKGLNYDFTIDWGDGTTSEITSEDDPDLSHYYDSREHPSVTITVEGVMEGFANKKSPYNGDLRRIVDLGDTGLKDLSDAFSNNGKLQEIVSMGNTSEVTTFEGAFFRTNNLKTLPDFDTSSTTNMLRMFWMSKVESIPELDVSSVTNMNSMFKEATNFNQDIGSWDVRSVRDMEEMFQGASSFNQDISSWDVSNIPSMKRMFWNAKSFNQPLNSWDVSNVNNMSDMFHHASSFNQPLNSWDVSNVIDMDSMFKYASSFNQPLNSWDVSSVTSMRNIFEEASNFNQDISSWDVSSVKDMYRMFYEAPSFNQPLNSWDVSSLTYASDMFFGASSFNQDISSWDVSSVTNVSDMFRDASSFNQPLNSWDVSNVIRMERMFYNASVFSQDISSWCVTNLTSQPDSFDTASGFEGQTAIQPQWGVSCDPDTTPPSLTLNGSASITLTQGDTYIEQGATAIDDRDGDISANVIIGGSGVDTSTAGRYGVTYNVSDTAGNSATPTVRIITVRADTDIYVSLIGMTVEEARNYSAENNFRFRVGVEDGVSRMLTMDYVIGRATATVENGFIVSYRVEGGGALPIRTPEPIRISEPEPELTSEPTSASEPEVTPESEPTMEPEPVPALTMEPEPELTSEPTMEPEPIPTSTPEPTSASEATSTSEPEVTPEPETTSQPTMEPEPEPESRSRNNSKRNITTNTTLGGDSVDRTPRHSARSNNIKEGVGSSPVVTLKGKKAMILTVGDTYIDAGANAVDVEDGDVTANVQFQGRRVDTSRVGVYISSYYVIDNHGMRGTSPTRIVKVVNPGKRNITTNTTVGGDSVNSTTRRTSSSISDNVKEGLHSPVVTLKGKKAMILTVGDTYIDAGANAIDAEDGDVTANVEFQGRRVDTSRVGVYISSYYVIDNHGMRGTSPTRIVKVVKP